MLWECPLKVSQVHKLSCVFQKEPYLCSTILKMHNDSQLFKTCWCTFVSFIFRWWSLTNCYKCKSVMAMYNHYPHSPLPPWIEHLFFLTLINVPHYSQACLCKPMLFTKFISLYMLKSKHSTYITHGICFWSFYQSIFFTLNMRTIWCKERCHGHDIWELPPLWAVPGNV